MNKDLQDRLSSLEGLIGIQKGCVSSGEYMHGMANGMILAHHIFTAGRGRNEDCRYVTVTKKRRKNVKVRHKHIRKAKVVS